MFGVRPGRALRGARGRVWRLVSGVVVLAVVAAVALVGTGLAAGGPAASGGRPVPPPAPPGRTAPDRTQQSDQQTRQRSRSAHEGENRDQAVGVAKQSFGVDRPLWRGPGASDGATIERYVGDHQAVERVGSRRLLVSSVLPLVVGDSSGVKRPVSLTLTDSGDAWAPAQPLVDVRVAKNTSAAISLAGGIEVTPGSAQSTQAPTIAGNRVVYANSARDSDFMVEPVPAGAETMWQLRSERSPTSEQLRFRLPPGAQLQMSSTLHGAAEVVRNGQQLLQIPAAVARDASGAPVPVSMSVSGTDTLDVRVDLSGSVHFPVLVDPALQESNGASNNANQWQGWGQYASSGGFGLYGYYNLLQVLADPAQAYYPAGSYGEWYVTQHGDATITEVTVYGGEHQQDTKSNFFAGIYNPGSYVGGWTTNGYAGTMGGSPYTDGSVFDGRAVAFCAQSNYGGSDGNQSNPLCNQTVGAYGFAFGLNINNPGMDVANDTRITGALVTYLDTNPPDTVSIGGFPAGWVDSLPNMWVYGHDNGVGVQTFTANVGGQQQSQGEGCASPQTGYFCPASDARYFNFSSPPEGQNTITATVADEVGNQRTGQAQVKVDRTPPSTPSLSGTLWDRRGQTITDGSYTLNASSGDSLSGLRSIEVQVDGNQATYWTASCSGTDGCSGAMPTWTFDSTKYPSGTHTINVVAKDQVADQPGVDNTRHVASQSFQITTVRPVPVNTVAPVISGTTTDGQTLNASTGSWSDPSPRYSYQWQSCSSSGISCLPIQGATSSTYTLGHGDVGTTLNVIVTAANAAGATPATSAQTATIAAVQPYQQYEDTVAADGPAAQYRFADPAGSATLTDSAGSRNATNTAIALGQSGAFNGSNSGLFNGSSSYGAIPSDPLLGATTFTAEAWVYWRGGAPWQRIFDLGSGPGNFMVLTPSSFSGQLLFALTPTSGNFRVGAPALAQNSWQYVAVSEDSAGTVTLYLNGRQVGQATGATITPASLGATTQNWLGRSQYSADPNLNGNMQDVAFYTKALTAARIQAHYAASAVAPTNSAPPTIAGTATDGHTLTASPGTWGGTSPSYAYQWQSCDVTGANCANLQGATGASYTLGHGDVDSTLRVLVTASNPGGAVTATSAPTGVIAAVVPYDWYEDGVATDSAVNQYQFADAPGASMLADSAGTIPATNTAIALGQPGAFTGSNSGAFNGSSSFAALSANPLQGSATFTAEAWVYWRGGGAWQRIFDFGSGTGNYMFLTPSGASGLQFAFTGGAGGGSVTAAALAQNSWQHVAVTEDSSGTITMYVNGRQVGQATGASVSPASLGATTQNWLGRSQFSTDPYFNGNMQDVAFYTDALTADQVRDHYQTVRPPPTIATSGELDQASAEPRLIKDSPDLVVDATQQSDAGDPTPGVQSIKVQIDGKDPTPAVPFLATNVASQPGPCNGCSLQHTFTLDTSALTAGVHSADVTVTDFAGDTSNSSWDFTIDRTSPLPYCSNPSSDPAGCQPERPSTVAPSCTPGTPTPQPADGSTLTSAAAIASTQQAMPSALAPPDSASIESLTVAPGLSGPVPAATGWASAATLMPSTLGATAATYTVGGGSAAVCVTPASTMADAPAPQAVNNTAVEYPATGPATDTILRPTPFGVQEISQIRGPTAPETTSETIALAAGQYLQQLDSGSIAIMDPSLSTISSTLPASGTGTTDPPDPSVAPDGTTYPGAGDDLPGLIPYTPADLAGLTPDDADILPPQTQYQYESENRLLNYADQDADGQEAAIIEQPYAQDANGTPVPTSMAITGPNTVAFTTHHLGITSAPTNTTAATTPNAGTSMNAAYATASPYAAPNTLAASTPSAYPVITSHKTATTSKNRNKPGNHTALFGLSGGVAANISAYNSQNEGTGKVRAGLRIGDRPDDRGDAGKPPPTARYVMSYQDSCDRFVAKKQDVLKVGPPTKGGPRAQADYKACKRAAKFVQQAMHAKLPVYITVDPDPVGTEPNRPNHAHSPAQYVRSVQRLWKYSVFKNVRVWGATNEPEHNGKLPSDQAAEIWKKMQAAARDHRQCDKCVIVAGEFNGDNTRQVPNGSPPTDSYIGRYMQYLKDHHLNPKVWALHDYYDVVRNDTGRFTPSSNPSSTTKQYAPSKQYAQARYYARRVRNFNNRDRVWLSEQGVLLVGSGADLTNNKNGTATQKQQAAAKRFTRLAMQEPNIDLVNYYAFFGASKDLRGHPFDSALVRPPDPPPPGAQPPYTFGAFRPAYCYLTKEPQSNCYQGTGRFDGDGQ